MRWGWAFTPKICKPPHASLPPPPLGFVGGAIVTTLLALMGKEMGPRSLSCQALMSSLLQTTEMCFLQDSVDVVIGETAVTMETILWGARSDFRLRCEETLGDAIVLAMCAWPGAGHNCSFWAADPITAVTAGRLQTQNRYLLWNVASGIDAEDLNKTFYAVPQTGALHLKHGAMFIYTHNARKLALYLFSNLSVKKINTLRNTISLHKDHCHPSVFVCGMFRNSAVSPLNPNRTQVGWDALLIFWPEEAAAGPPHCHSYGVVSCANKNQKKERVSTDEKRTWNAKCDRNDAGKGEGLGGVLHSKRKRRPEEPKIATHSQAVTWSDMRHAWKHMD